jgi:hypothetical protein
MHRLTSLNSRPESFASYADLGYWDSSVVVFWIMCVRIVMLLLSSLSLPGRRRLSGEIITLKPSFTPITLSPNSILGYLLLHFSYPIRWGQHQLTWLRQIEVLEMDIGHSPTLRQLR